MENNWKSTESNKLEITGSAKAGRGEATCMSEVWVATVLPYQRRSRRTDEERYKYRQIYRKMVALFIKREAAAVTIKQSKVALFIKREAAAVT